MAVQGLIALIQAGVAPEKPPDSAGGVRRKAARRAAAARVHRARLREEDDILLSALASALSCDLYSACNLST